MSDKKTKETYDMLSEFVSTKEMELKIAKKAVKNFLLEIITERTGFSIGDRVIYRKSRTNYKAIITDITCKNLDYIDNPTIWLKYGNSKSEKQADSLEDIKKR